MHDLLIVQSQYISTNTTPTVYTMWYIFLYYIVIYLYYSLYLYYIYSLYYMPVSIITLEKTVFGALQEKKNISSL